MFNEAQLREVVKQAAKLHEESYNFDTLRYGLSLEDSALRALEEAGLPVTLAPLIYLSLSGWWNDVLAWAAGEYERDDAEKVLLRP